MHVPANEFSQFVGILGSFLGSVIGVQLLRLFGAFTLMFGRFLHIRGAQDQSRSALIM